MAVTRRLFIASENFGSERPVKEWEVFDLIAGPHVDHVGNPQSLKRFEDNTFEEIYASHVLEHISYRKPLMDCLKEWRRVLKPGGVLHVAVPDMWALCQLFLRDDLSDEERLFVMRLLFGGQVTSADVHLVGLWERMLEIYLAAAGFVDIERLEHMPYGLKDASAFEFKGVLTSLNMRAKKADQDASKTNS